MLRSTAGVGSLVSGDRRMGKTSLLRKAEHVLAAEHVVFRLSAETDDVELFAHRLQEILRRHSRLADEVARWDLTVDVSWRGVRLQREAGGAAPTSEDTDDLFQWAASRAAPSRLIVILDEIAVLASAIGRQRPGGALEFLRSLRRARQEVDNLAIVLAGSIGLHHAVPDSAPINDLQKVRVGPLQHDDAVYLARCLIRGEDLRVDDELAVAQAMAAASDAVPYYIHHLANAARRREGPLDGRAVFQLRSEALADPDDPWNMRHYRDRLPEYYGDQHELAALMLDAYAIADEPLDVGGVLGHIASVESERRPSRSELVSLVEKLEADHYLRRGNNADTFAQGIVRDAWRAIRRL